MLQLKLFTIVSLWSYAVYVSRQVYLYQATTWLLLQPNFKPPSHDPPTHPIQALPDFNLLYMQKPAHKPDVKRRSGYQCNRNLSTFQPLPTPPPLRFCWTKTYTWSSRSRTSWSTSAMPDVYSQLLGLLTRQATCPWELW